MFQSLIDTRPAFSGSQARDVANARPQTFSGGYGSGGSSRAAASRAATDMGRNKAASTMDEYRRQWQQNTEKARSEDLLYQQAAEQARTGLDLDRRTTIRQQDLALRQGNASFQQYRDQARQNASQGVLQSGLGAIFGQNNLMRAAPLIGEAYAGGARPFGGMGGGGLMSSLLGR